MRCLWIMFATAFCFLFLLNCMMLQWAPHMLKKLGINKLRKRSKLPGIHRPNRPCLCWKAGCCKATWRNWQERKPACTHCGQLTEYPTVLTPPLPTPLPPKISFYISNWYQFFFFFFFWFNFTHPILEHHYVLCSRLFYHVDNISDPNHKLKAPLPPEYDNTHYNLRRQRHFNIPKLCTNRTSTTFIDAMSKQPRL